MCSVCKRLSICGGGIQADTGRRRTQPERNFLFFIHGDQDNRAWVEESGEVFVGLQRLGKPVTYVSYPGEGHWEGTWTREHVLDYWDRLLEFLSQELRQVGRSEIKK